MVSETPDRRKTIVNKLWFTAIIVILLLVDVLVVLLSSDAGQTSKNDTEIGAYETSDALKPESVVVPEEEPVKPSEDNTTKPNKLSVIDFQPAIDGWVSSTGGEKGVIIYDLDLDKVVGEYHADTKFKTASLYKLFVVYEGYRRVQNGEWKADDVAGNTGRTIIKCLDLAIRESDSECAETMWNMIGRENLNKIVQAEYGIPSITVSTLMATPREIMQMMRIFYEHKEIKDQNLLDTMWDSMLNQPITEYNWRQGLPSGFTADAKVYNKVGWAYVIDEEDEKGNAVAGHWDIYNDAAIVDFKTQNRQFIIVIMTNNVPYQRIRAFGTLFEEMFLREN